MGSSTCKHTLMHTIVFFRCMKIVIVLREAKLILCDAQKVIDIVYIVSVARARRSSTTVPRSAVASGRQAVSSSKSTAAQCK